jgi:hypothetical protein
MRNFSDWTFLIAFAAIFYLGFPALLVWGWLRWRRNPQSRTISSTLSLIGFILATLSALLAVSTILYALAIGGFRYYDALLLKIYAAGGLLAIGGFVFAVSGIWRPNPLRWHAPICAITVFLYWLMMASSE